MLNKTNWWLAKRSCPGPNPHGKLGNTGFPVMCAMLPDVAVAANAAVCAIN